jgi:hypothetical protein
LKSTFFCQINPSPKKFKSSIVRKCHSAKAKNAKVQYSKVRQSKSIEAQKRMDLCAGR